MLLSIFSLTAFCTVPQLTEHLEGLHGNYYRGIIRKKGISFMSVHFFLTDGLFEDPEINNLKIFTEPHSLVRLLLATDLWGQARY